MGEGRGEHTRNLGEQQDVVEAWEVPSEQEVFATPGCKQQNGSFVSSTDTRRQTPHRHSVKNSQNITERGGRVGGGGRRGETRQWVREHVRAPHSMTGSNTPPTGGEQG